jgi:hypothetical protein
LKVAVPMAVCGGTVTFTLSDETVPPEW